MERRGRRHNPRIRIETIEVRIRIKVKTKRGKREPAKMTPNQEVMMVRTQQMKCLQAMIPNREEDED